MLGNLVGWNPVKTGAIYTWGGGGCWTYGLKYGLTRVLPDSMQKGRTDGREGHLFAAGPFRPEKRLRMDGPWHGQHRPCSDRCRHQPDGRGPSGRNPEGPGGEENPGRDRRLHDGNDGCQRDRPDRQGPQAAGPLSQSGGIRQSHSLCGCRRRLVVGLFQGLRLRQEPAGILGPHPAHSEAERPGDGGTRATPMRSASIFTRSAGLLM